MTSRRRSVLTALAGGLAGLAGCSLRPSRDPDPSSTVTPVAPPTDTPGDHAVDLAPVAAPWSSFQADAGNTGTAPGAAGPGVAPDVAWRTATWGLVTDTVVADGTAFAVTGLHQRNRRLLAVNAETGERRWQRTVDGRRGHGLAAADGTLYAGIDRLQAFDVETGELRWEDRRGVEGGPVVTRGTVLAAAASTNQLRAVDAVTGELRRGYAVATRTMPAIEGDRIYVPGPEEVRAIDVTGETHWSRAYRIAGGSRRSSSGRSTVAAPPTATGGAVYVPTSEGLLALDADSGSVRWAVENPLGWSSPAVADGRVFVGGHREVDGGRVPAVSALDAATGEEVWRFEPPRSVPAHPVVADDVVYVGSTGTHLFALDADTGAVHWTLEFEWPVGTPALYGDGLLANVGGRLYAIEGGSGGTTPWAGVVRPATPGTPGAGRDEGDGEPATYADHDFYFGTAGYAVTADVDVESDPDAPVDLSVAVDGGRIDEDEAVTLEFALTNEGETPLVVDSGAPAPYGVVRFEEPGDGGRSLTAWTDAYEESPHVHTSPRRVAMVEGIGVTTTVRPGEVVRETYELSTATSGIQPGTYRYEDVARIRTDPQATAGDDAGSWQSRVTVELDVAQPAPEEGTVVRDLVVAGRDPVPTAFPGRLSVDMLAPVTDRHPGLVEVTLEIAVDEDGSIASPGRLPFGSAVGLAPGGSRLLLVPAAWYAPAHVVKPDDRESGPGSWIPTYRPHVERRLSASSRRFEADARIAERFLVVGHPDDGEPLSPGTYRFEQGYADGSVEFPWGFLLSVRGQDG